jgi:hypothetical protein
MGGACSIQGGEMFTILMGNPEEKTLLGRLRYRWDNIKMNIKDTRRDGVDVIDLLQDSRNLAGCYVDGDEPWVPKKQGEFFRLLIYLQSNEIHHVVALIKFQLVLRCQLYMFRTVTVHPQELLCTDCTCRLWYVL